MPTHPEDAAILIFPPLPVSRRWIQPPAGCSDVGIRTPCVLSTHASPGGLCRLEALPQNGPPVALGGNGSPIGILCGAVIPDGEVIGSGRMIEGLTGPEETLGETTGPGVETVLSTGPASATPFCAAGNDCGEDCSLPRDRRLKKPCIRPKSRGRLPEFRSDLPDLPELAGGMAESMGTESTPGAQLIISSTTKVFMRLSLRDVKTGSTRSGQGVLAWYAEPI